MDDTNPSDPEGLEHNNGSQSTARAEETSIPNHSTMVDTNPFDPDGLEHHNGSQSTASAEESSIPNPPTVLDETNPLDREGPGHHNDPTISALANALHHPTPPVNAAPMDEQIILPAPVLDASGDEIRESFGWKEGFHSSYRIP